MARLGIFGGTFDPPHNGHRLLAESALQQIPLNRVFWLLTPDPPHKDRPDITPYSIRKRMVAAAIKGNANFELCEVESERPGPHYMVDTVEILQKRFPADELHLLIGEDSLRDLPLWHQPERLLPLCFLCVLPRPNVEAHVETLERRYPGIRRRIRFLDSKPMDISSTEIRNIARIGANFAGLVPKGVADVIRENQLYQPR